jgi:uncharacterized membrane protein (DUF4010 family)
MTLTVDLESARNVGVAVLAGLAVGIEREWSGHASGPSARFAGARTFLLLGLIGGVGGWLATRGFPGFGMVLLGGGSALAVAAYVMAARRSPEDVEGTTEVAALTVIALGAVAGLGAPLLTSAATSLLLLALAEKTRIHAVIERIGDRELGAALRFAVLALVVLPLLPAGPFGPFGSIRPRTLWSVVLLLSGITFAGYISRRALGAAAGYGLTGLLGGVVSSTAVILSFANQSRRDPSSSGALARGALGAAAVTIPRVIVILIALDLTLARAALNSYAPMLLLSLGMIAVVLRRPGIPTSAEPSDTQSPLRLGSAVRMALVLQGVLIAVPLAQQTWGVTGVLASAAILGMTSTYALVVAITTLSQDAGGGTLAMQALAVGVTAGMVLKLGVGLAAGSGAFRLRLAPGLLILGAAAVLGYYLA